MFWGPKSYDFGDIQALEQDSNQDEKSSLEKDNILRHSTQATGFWIAILTQVLAPKRLAIARRATIVERNRPDYYPDA